METNMRPITYTAAAIAALLAGCTSPATTPGASGPENAAPAPAEADAMQDLLDYVKGQKTTGFIVMRGGQTLVEENWSAPENQTFAIFLHGKTDTGALLEDVASQQKSFIAVLMGIAIDKGLVAVDRPVSDYLGAGWSNATPEQENEIRVDNILMMNSGLDEEFDYSAPPGTEFFYNTPVYAVSKEILTSATGLPLDQLTREWLTEPAGMSETAWRQRPPALANVGNSTGLVTTPRDIARFGQLVLDAGMSESGTRIISEASLQAMFEPSETNPAYGRLWWLNGGAFAVMGQNKRKEGPLVPVAPDDLVAALGYLDRRLYVVPSLDLVAVRTGADAPDDDFDEELWQRLNRAID